MWRKNKEKCGRSWLSKATKEKKKRKRGAGGLVILQQHQQQLTFKCVLWYQRKNDIFEQITVQVFDLTAFIWFFSTPFRSQFVWQLTDQVLFPYIFFTLPGTDHCIRPPVETLSPHRTSPHRPYFYYTCILYTHIISFFLIFFNPASSLLLLPLFIPVYLNFSLIYPPIACNIHHLQLAAKPVIPQWHYTVLLTERLGQG